MSHAEVAGPDLTVGVPIAELPESGMLAGRVGDEAVLLVRTPDGLRAIGATCTHYSAPLADGAVIDGTIRCPWHHACFDLASGAVLRAPALAPLPVFRVEQRGDRVFVGDRIEKDTIPQARGPENVVIIGAGAAGLNVANTLRRKGYDGGIVMISRENDLPYDKPNLSKDFMAGTAPVEWLPVYPPEHYEQQRIDLKLGVTVMSIDTSAKRITTSSGEHLSYGALVLATGASPRLLEVPGADRVRYLRTRGDAEEIVAAAASARKVVVIGSGFIGLEVAASLRQKGLETTVVSHSPVPLGRLLGDEVGNHIRRIHEGHGVVFFLGRQVAAVETEAVVLDDGSRIEADLVVAGLGVAPTLDLAQSAGLQTSDGVVVDEYLQTSAPDVFACGDIACWPDARIAGPVRIEHWVVAGRQGETVAANILGERQSFSAVPFFWSAHFDVTINYLGYSSGWDSVEVAGSLAANDATITYRQAGKVLAVATIGRDLVSLAAEHAIDAGDWSGLDDLLRQADASGTALR